ncbi:MAG TPA: 50S ribosomal protein L15 [Planctomycetota bacterium]|nr:50S ribosomal protein L15 [Planctomycetota bacterium]
MQLHQARRANLSNKKKFRVGRGPGSGVGKTAGRGIKGATSRSGYAMKVTYEGGQMPIFRRLPKRGFKNGKFRETFSVVNVGELSSFKAGSKVGPDELRDAGVLRGPTRWPVKILGEGEIKVALTVSADAFSASAIDKIQKAGGKAEWIGGAPKKPAPDFKKIEAEKKKAAKAKAPAAAEKGEKPAEGAAPAAGAEAPKAAAKPAAKPAPKPPEK